MSKDEYYSPIHYSLIPRWFAMLSNNKYKTDSACAMFFALFVLYDEQYGKAMDLLLQVDDEYRNKMEKLREESQKSN